MIRNALIWRRRPLIAAAGAGRSLLPPLPSAHHLLPIAAVSGTAKGKGKGKEAPALKRSIVPKKKKPTASGGVEGGAASGRGRAHKENLERLTRMAEACLSAPTPIRYLTPKQRWREAEREKLGLISKERQREIDMAKAKAKSKEVERPVIMGTPGLDLITLGLVDADKIPKYELTAEDGKRLAKEYSRVLMRKHRARQKAETTLLRNKKEAIAALPEPLRTAALVPDFTPFPRNRFMATLTPPIEGYIQKVQEAAKKFAVKEKLR